MLLVSQRREVDFGGLKLPGYPDVRMRCTTDISERWCCSRLATRRDQQFLNRSHKADSRIGTDKRWTVLKPLPFDRDNVAASKRRPI
jgi:hypothetical protein